MSVEIGSADFGNQPENFADLMNLLEARLDHGRRWSCKVAGLRKKMGKWIVEFEAKDLHGTDADEERYIGKIYASDRGRGNFDALMALWHAGFRPPSPYTVVRPIAYIPERCLLIQEKAPGNMAAEMIFGESDAACTALDGVARWLAALQSSPVSPPSRVEKVRESVTLHGCNLAQSLPQQAPRLRRLMECALAELDASHLTPLAPSHGDLHPGNVFVAQSGRVTVIDMDTFGMQERAADVAYLIAQTATMGHRRLGSFLATGRIRDHFLRAYLKEAGSLSRSRLSVYLGMVFLQSLFYELCILKSDNFALIEPWLKNAERCLLHGEVTLMDGSVTSTPGITGPVPSLASTPKLVSPYGGKLVDLLVPPEENEAVKIRARRLHSIQLPERSVCDLELLATGAFSPLDRFMGREDYQRVLDEMRLTSGFVFPIPVTLPVDPGPEISLDREIALRDTSNQLLAVMRIEDIYEWDLRETEEKVFGTHDARHPLVAEMHRWGRMNISGPLRVLQLPAHYDFEDLRLTPGQARTRLTSSGRRNVVAFQTRNPLHRAHEELTKRAIRELGALLLLHPVVGITRPGDIDHYTRVRTYRALAATYDRDQILLSVLPLAMRMAGPKEALWHALIRRNYGANFLIVGRDHGSPGVDSRGKPFYGPYDAQNLVERFREDLGVGVVPFRELVYLPAEGRYEESTAIPSGARTVSISGTQLREEYLNKGKVLPAWFTRPEIAQILAEAYPPRHRQGICIWFTGLSGAGKSTIAEMLSVLLLEYGRQVTILDGDVVRTHLSRGLGFSRNDRDANNRRMGFVAAEIVRHGGAVICAAVSPYRTTRNDVRNMIGNGHFVEVFVNTPLEVCEQRDRKGMYAKARRGEIRGFTGIDDPYEEPLCAEITLDTTLHKPEENARRILRHLIEERFVRTPQVHAQEERKWPEVLIKSVCQIADPGLRIAD